ncbi:radical SAM/SPASM domain-containing protein [Enterococcus sp. AZ192]|uniref:radical SAM/SPASM domain-containing protein n=1 Tax=unclassified Enterococcus TaxID=2608891 RepID=UPI003D28CE58
MENLKKQEKAMLRNDGKLENNKKFTEFSDFPEYIEIQFSGKCNAFCKVCPHPQVRKEIPLGKMEVQLIDQILEECQHYRHKIINIEPYLNNEPFLDRDFLKTLRKIKKIGCNVEVSSNLSILTYETIDAIVEEELISELRCSIFGFFYETYQSIMGLDYINTWNNFFYLLKKVKQKKSLMTIQFTMIDKAGLISQEEITVARKYFKELGVKFKVYPYLDRAENNGSKNEKVFLENKYKVVGCKSDYLKNRLAINYDGTVSLCCQDWRRQVIIGDLKTQTIKEIWDSKKVNSIREQMYGETDPAKAFFCQKCELALLEQVKVR